MIEIDIIKQAGRKAKVAFYYRLPARLQGVQRVDRRTRTLRGPTQRLVQDGEVLEYIITVRLRDPTNARQELANLYEEHRKVAFNSLEKSTPSRRVDGVWEK